MQKLLKRQYYRESNKIGIVDIVIMLFIFSAPILNCVLYITKGTATSGQLAIVYVIVALLSVVAAIYNFHRKISYNLIKCIISFVIILLGFLITKISWEINNSTFESELKLYLATFPSVILITYALENKKKKDINLKLIFLINIAITIICSLVIFSSNGITSAGLLQDTSGFIYQNTSYYVAYAIGMSIFLIGEILKTGKKKITYFLILLTIVQFIICVSAGGRGGVVLATILIIVGIIMVKGVKEAFFWSLIIGIFSIIILEFILDLLPKIGIESVGLTRIIESTTSTFDNSRSILWTYSLFYFFNNPVLGNGIGSVFFLFGQYSHNFILDILCETGILGTFIIIIIICYFIKKIGRIYSKGNLYRFMLISFICGIVMNLFSGYIWVNQQILLPIVIILCSNHKFLRRKF